MQLLPKFQAISCSSARVRDDLRSRSERRLFSSAEALVIRARGFFHALQTELSAKRL